jgi:hypothetical protein
VHVRSHTTVCWFMKDERPDPNIQPTFTASIELHQNSPELFMIICFCSIRYMQAVEVYASIFSSRG